MKIFPLKPLSTFDNMRNFYNLVEKTSKNLKTNDSCAVSLNERKPLKKGRSICDMLSE